MAALLIGIIAVVAPLLIRAALMDPGDAQSEGPWFPIETAVVAVIALVLSIRARKRAKAGLAGGKRLATAGIVVAAIGLVSAFGQFGQLASDASDSAALLGNRPASWF